LFYIVELAVVIGKQTRDIPASQAMDNVAGKFSVRKYSISK
jgi:2-keto-4-pentenoate hydratase/2-oxohepta-3-ene-1,7-dioic acid hydratase in catechol pathway